MPKRETEIGRSKREQPSCSHSGTPAHATGAVKQKKETVWTENDILKYEIAEELGLLDKVRTSGWKSLTAKESGRIGGMMTKRKKAALDE